MAIKLPKFLTVADAKSRIMMLFAGVAVFFAVIYFVVHYLGGGGGTTGPTKVANAPSELKSVPGSQLSPEYYRALSQANVQASQQAQLTGGSAVPTLINVPTGVSTGASGECTVLCPSEDKLTVADELDDLVKANKITQATANQLNDLAKKNVSVEEYAAALDDLVRQGKLTPEQARQLLERYKKQHANALAAQSARVMDGMIKNGQLSLTAANELLDLQKSHLTPEEYAAKLQQMVKEGKLSQQAADALLAQYVQQTRQEAVKKGAFAIAQMAKEGQITADVAKKLMDLQNKSVPLDAYASELDQLVKEGKMTPATAAKLLALYKASREASAVSTCLAPLQTKGGEFAAEWQRLRDLQSNNATLAQYTDELKRGVQDGVVTPEMAACALQQYQVVTSVPQYEGAVAPTVSANIPGAEDFAALQQRVQRQQADTTSSTLAGAAGGGSQQFAAAQQQAQEAAEQARNQRIQALQSAMATQAQSLQTVWQAPVMVHMGSSDLPDSDKGKTGGMDLTGGGSKGSATQNNEASAAAKPTLIKAGTIYFAVLDTAVDSDYPDTPVLATIIQGPFKGAKLLGKLSLAKGQDKVSLNFTSMDKDDWTDSKDVSAFAIDPDTARTVLANNVDYHYFKRYGAIMAAAFVQGYSTAITQAGTSTTGIFGTSSTHPSLSAGNKFAVGLGQVGSTMGQAISSYINTPTTVKVNSGVGIGILFTSSVTG